MCGIIGAINLGGDRLHYSESDVLRALRRMEHRGPDDGGVWWGHDRSVVLGHRRLSILDLSAAGHQPMAIGDPEVVISYNGEVYNFLELRRDLESAGHRFLSSTDTEVILAGYLEYGPAVIDRLRGMFAMAVWDGRRRELLLARDRLGIKPLYTTRVGNVLAFASEIGPLLELPGTPRELNVDGMREYLTFGKVYAPATMFSGIEKFPAAHWGLYPEGRSSTRCRYWTPYDESHHFQTRGEDDAADHLRGLLDESVRLRTISDVPVGVFLSGGVDSTANLALMTGALGRGVNTFTAGFQGEDDFDERGVARRAAAHYGAHHQEVEITRDDLVGALPLITSHLDEPVSDPTVIPLYFLSRLARQSGVPVILNGDGGDELFCGYRKHLRFLRIAPWWRALRSLPGWSRSLIAWTGRGVGLNGVAADLLERAAAGVEMYVGATGPLKGTDALRSVIGSEGADSLYAAVRRGWSDFASERRSDDYAEWLTYWGIRSEVEHVFLYRADRMGMAHAVEIRVPFLDHHVVEFAQHMPQALKYRNGETKWILKRSMEPIVPDEFLYRKKQGFCVPLRRWGGDVMTQTTADVLPMIGRDWGVFDDDFVDSALDLIRRTGDTDNGGALSWMLYNLSVWYQTWFR